MTPWKRRARSNADYRELARIAFAARLFGIGFDMYAKSHHVPLVLAAKFGVDTIFLLGTYFAGRAAGWLLGVDTEFFSIEEP